MDMEKKLLFSKWKFLHVKAIFYSGILEPPHEVLCNVLNAVHMHTITFSPSTPRFSIRDISGVMAI